MAIRPLPGEGRGKDRGQHQRLNSHGFKRLHNAAADRGGVHSALLHRHLAAAGSRFEIGPSAAASAFRRIGLRLVHHKQDWSK